MTTSNLTKVVVSLLLVAFFATGCDFVKKKTGINLSFGDSIPTDSLNQCFDQYRKQVEAVESLSEVIKKHQDNQFAKEEFPTLKEDTEAAKTIVDKYNSDLTEEQQTQKNNLDNRLQAAEKVISEAIK